MTVCLTISVLNLLFSFHSAATFPGGLPGSRWTDSLPIVEGHFTHDGMTVLVSDAAGQVSVGVRQGLSMNHPLST